MMNLHWLSYALKVTALFNVGAGLLNVLIDSNSWALGNFMFALVLMISSFLANHLYGDLTPLKPVRIKKRSWQPYDKD
jgi:hypothetical protein